MKQILSIILILTVLALPVSAASSVGGDVNSDGMLSLADVTQVLKHIAGWNVTIDTRIADVAGDSSVNLADVTAMLKRIAGWNITFKNDYGTDNDPNMGEWDDVT